MTSILNSTTCLDSSNYSNYCKFPETRNTFMNHVEIARRLKAPSGKSETEIDEIFTLTIDGR